MGDIDYMLVIECQTVQPSWLAHMRWASGWRDLTRRKWGCGVCGTRTFHRSNVRYAEAWNRKVAKERRARLRGPR